MSNGAAALSTAEMDRALEAEGRASRFSATHELQYRCESVAEQRQSFLINCLIGCVLYDMFLISDYIVTNESFHYYVIGRLGVFTPICLSSLYMIWRGSKFYQILICVPFVTAAATLSLLLTVSHGPFRSSYLFGDIFLMICGCAIARPRLPYAVCMVLLQFVIYQVTSLTTDIFDAESKIVGMLFCFTGGVVTIMTAYAIEQISRRAFLLSLRLRLMNQKLEAMAMTDALTGLGNRRCLEDATERFWKEESADVKMASFILIDIDRFKLFNDNYGHPAGDLCLSTLARQIAGAIRRDMDVAVRFGGEEIIVFLPHADFTEARTIAETVRLAIIDAGIPHPVIDPDAVVTASLGVATASVKDCAAADLIIRADMALYAAKRNGRNQVWPPFGPVKANTSLGSASSALSAASSTA